ncbi:MAG: Anaphase-promoting complex, cyclosome, subunit 3, partial [Deltaproteobacteria bacterium]|nr:Anaphase-promoting complex, cyclosome, subunit 3 [Deltaproteobacteria bacterium]
YPKGWYNLGVALFENGRHEEAAAAFREVVRWQPGHARARFNLGKVSLALGRGGQAVREFRTTASGWPCSGCRG